MCKDHDFALLWKKSWVSILRPSNHYLRSQASNVILTFRLNNKLCWTTSGHLASFAIYPQFHTEWSDLIREPSTNLQSLMFWDTWSTISSYMNNIDACETASHLCPKILVPFKYIACDFHPCLSYACAVQSSFEGSFCVSFSSVKVKLCSSSYTHSMIRHFQKDSLFALYI